MTTYLTRARLTFLGVICMTLSACGSREVAQEVINAPSPQESAVNSAIGEGVSRLPITTTKLSHTDTELEATFARGKAATTILVIKGGPRHPDFVAEPEIDSPYEFDYLVLNREGDFLLGAFGGAEAMEKGWNRYLEKNPEHVDALERHSDLFLASDAARNLVQRPTVGSQFKWEIETLIYSIDNTIQRNQLTDPGR